MQTTLDHNNMNAEQIQNWTLASGLFSLFTAIYNGIAGWGFSEWMGVLGFLGMVFSLAMQRHYNVRRDKREAEKHEWERQAFAARMLEQEQEDG